MISASQFDDFLLTNNTLLTHKVSRSCPNQYYCEKSDANITRYETTSEHIIGCTKLADFFLLTHPQEFARLNLNRMRIKEILEYHDDIEGYPGVGDTCIAHEEKRIHKERFELENLSKLAKLYPPAMRAHLLGVDTEFRKKETSESIFAHAIDKLQPIIYCAQDKYRDARGARGDDGNLLFTEEKVRRRSGPSFLPFPIINAYFEQLVLMMKKEGYLLE